MEKIEQRFEEAEAEKQVEDPEEEEPTLRLRRERTAKKESESSESDDDDDDDAAKESVEAQEMAANGTESEDFVLEDGKRVEDAHEVVLGSSINGGDKSEKTIEVFGSGTGSINGDHKSENLVFYDKVEGVNSAPEHNGEKDIVLGTGNSKENGSSSAEDLGNKRLSNSKNQETEITAEDSSRNYQNSSEIERVEDYEFTDYDVEGVLKKQNTHDLYCPNCKSCITRRVILRKRKRTVRISGEEVKRNKVGEATYGDEEVGAINGSQALTVDDDDEDDRDREPFIFKCLSCFTFFIPAGFRGRLAKENVRSNQQPSNNTRKNWFFPSIFPENKLHTTEQGSSSVQTEVGKQGIGVNASANSGDGNSQTSLSVATGKGHYSRTAVNNVNLNVESHTKPSPAVKYSSEGKGKATAANELDSTIVKAKEYSQAHKNKEDNSSVATFVKGSGVTTNTNGALGEHAEGKSKHLLISSDKESPSTRTLEEEEGKEAILLPPLISVHRDTDTDGKISISMDVPQEQQQDFRATIVTESIFFDGKSADKKDGESEASQHHITTKTELHVHSDETLKVDSISTVSNASAAQGKDTSLIAIDIHPAQPVQGIIAPPPDTCMQSSSEISVGERGRGDQASEEFQVEIVKSMVYGGLAESITSLSVVSSAAGGGAKTLNILALGMANLIGGLFILSHNIWELKSDNIVEVANQVSDIQVHRRRDRYREILGRRENFVVHFVVSLTSYLVFGLVPPVAYGFSFRKSDDTELKLFVVAASTLACICMLAIGRAYVQSPPKPYVKSVTTFVVLGFFVSGVSYAAGHLVERLLEKLGVFDGSGSVSNLLVAGTSKTWASY